MNKIIEVRVFVSSPGDCTKERDLVDKAITRINTTERDRRGFFLRSFRWERDVTPQIGVPAQKRIDASTPDYDVYLGILSHRFGTPTEGYGSGTEKEFQDALGRFRHRGKPWILFFFNKQAPAPSVGSEEEIAKGIKQLKQYKRVLQFKKELEGLYQEYDALSDGTNNFFDLVEKHLRDILSCIETAMWEPPRHKPRRDNRRIIPPPINGDASYSSDYRDWIKKECEDVSLLGLRLKHCQAVTLKSVYVPLITLKTGPTSISSGQFAKYAVVLDLLENNSLYISGAPGCGKSTFCRWVAWLACNKAIPSPDVEGKTAYTEVLPESLKKRLPLLVRLRGFWPFLPYTPGITELTGVQLDSALQKWFKNLSPPGLTWAHLQTQIKKGCVIIIFDGIDEVPVQKEEGRGTIYPRALLLSGLISAIPSWRQRRIKL